MNAMQDSIAAHEVGFDIPATPGMREVDIQTPCLILDLDALERNIKKMGDYAKAHGMRHRVHAKMHKSVDVAKLQQRLGGAAGVCCQKVSEAKVFARSGIKDILITNEIPLRSIGSRRYRSLAPARLSVSTTSPTSSNCRRRRRSMAPLLDASSR